MTQHPFLKYSGCGNDFILFLEHEVTPERVKSLCNRKWGIGADGVVTLFRSGKDSLTMRIFNSDGSEAAMCGNALRCSGHAAVNAGWGENHNTCFITTKAGQYQVVVAGDQITVHANLPTPAALKTLSLENGEKLTGFIVDSGVPHFVMFVDSVKALDLLSLGPLIRYHTHFLPQGTNVDWVEIVGLNQLKLRTYERGVEGETLACGTGALAAAWAAFQTQNLNATQTVTFLSGEKIDISFLDDKVIMSAPCKLIFRGELTNE